MDAQTSELYQKLYSADIISDLRIIGEDKDSVLFAVKRSKYKTRIPRTFTPNIAYLAGVIAGDGLFAKQLDRLYDTLELELRFIITHLII